MVRAQNSFPACVSTQRLTKHHPEAGAQAQHEVALLRRLYSACVVGLGQRVLPVQALVPQSAAALAPAPCALEADLQQDASPVKVSLSTTAGYSTAHVRLTEAVLQARFVACQVWLLTVSISKSRTYSRPHRLRLHFSTKHEPCSSASRSRSMPERVCSPSTFWLMTQVSLPARCRATRNCGAWQPLTQRRCSIHAQEFVSACDQRHIQPTEVAPGE